MIVAGEKVEFLDKTPYNNTRGLIKVLGTILIASNFHPGTVGRNSHIHPGGSSI